MKKHLQSAIALFLLLEVLAANLTTVQAFEARFTGVNRITSSLTISSTGAASCSGRVVLHRDYIADLTVELKQDGATIKTWKDSGEAVLLPPEEPYYVKSGHDYVVTTTATVYDSNNNIIETPCTDSLKRSY